MIEWNQPRRDPAGLVSFSVHLWMRTAHHTKQARALNKETQQRQILHTSGSGRGKYSSFDLHPRAGWERQARDRGFRREIFRNRRFLNGALVTLPLYPGPPREPSAAGRVGKGRAAE